MGAETDPAALRRLGKLLDDTEAWEAHNAAQNHDERRARWIAVAGRWVFGLDVEPLLESMSAYELVDLESSLIGLCDDVQQALLTKRDGS
jgi:hypothetical protein